MKKIILLSVMLIAFLFLQACSVSESETSVTILNAPMSLNPGETFQLELEVNNPSGLRIHFQTSNRDVLIVDDQGLVYGVSKGVASITVSIGGVVSEPVISNVLSVPGEFIFNLIDNLSRPYVREEVIAARGGYEALDEAEKLKVTNINVLEDAEAYFDEIDEAFEAIANVVYPYVRADLERALELYDNLTDEQEAYMTNRVNLANAENYFYEIDDVMFEIQLLSEPYDRDTVTYVRGMYEELALSQQALITNYQNLLDAEAYVLLYEEALEVERMIHSLQLPYDTAEVSVARNAYDALTLEQQALVSNLADLETAEQVLIDVEAATVVINLIDALTEPYDQTAVTNARDSYSALTGSQQSYVTNLSDLEAAEQVLLDIVAAQTVIDVINLISEPYNEAFITNIRESYENLTASQQTYVTNLSKLEEAEQALIDIAAAQLVIEEIDQLSADPVDIEAVASARVSYDALTEAQQTLVGNLSLLEALETTVSNIKVARAFDNQVETSAMLYRDIITSESSQDIDYGFSVASNDRYVVVGAPLDSGNVSDSGRVYVYDLEDPSYLRILDASNARLDSRFGESVAIDGDYIVVGASFAGANSSGRAYVYRLSDETFERIIRSSDASPGDKFGYSVAIDGDMIVVSAIADDDIGADSGSIYMYKISDTLYESKIIASDGGFLHNFGWRVAINETVIAVSAYRKTVDTKSFAGGVYLYDRTTGQEIEKVEAFDATNSQSFGHDIELTQTHLIVGAIGDATNGTSSGAVYVYDLTNISDVRKITASDGAASDLFGFSVAATNQYIFVSARGDDDQASNSGSVYVYQYVDINYEYKLTIEDGAASDLFGHDVFATEKMFYTAAVNKNTSGAIFSYQLSFKDNVTALRTTYDGFTNDQKTYVESLDTLIGYETLLSDIDAFKLLIDPIRNAGGPANLLPDPSVLLDPANTAYEAFSKVEQLFLDQDDILVLYESNMYFSEVDEVIAAIALNIYGSKTLRIEARSLYEALDDTQKTLITNYQRLLEAEAITSLDFQTRELILDTGITNIKQLEAADMDFDGDLDFVYATSNTLGVIINNGTFYSATTIDTFSGNAFTFGLIDTIGQGVIDIVLQDPESTFIIHYDNNGNATFERKFISGGLMGDSKALVVSDINGDGYEDFVYISSNVNALSYVENNQDGTFSISRLSTSSTYQIIDIDVVDIDSDGDLDIVSVSSNQSNIKLFLNDGNETFTVRNVNTTLNSITHIVTGDFNGDDIVDILVAHQIRDNDGYLLSYTKRFVNDGSLNFTMNSETAYGHTIGTLIAGDLEGDGDLDVLHTETTISGYTQNFVLGVFIMRQFDGELGTDYLNFVDVSTVLLIDENNDGLSDIVYVLPDGKIYIAINEYVAPIIND